MVKRGKSLPDKEKYPWCNPNIKENYFMVNWFKLTNTSFGNSIFAIPIKIIILAITLVITLFLYVFSVFVYCLSNVLNRRRAKENKGTTYGGYIVSEKSSKEKGVHTLGDLKSK